MSTYSHGYEVVQRPAINWAGLLAASPLTAWIPKIAWARVSLLTLGLAFNFALWVLLIRGASWLIG